MAENVVAEVRKLLQDLIAPDLKALSYRLDGLQKQVEFSEKSMLAQIDAMDAQLGAMNSQLGAMHSQLTAMHDQLGSFRSEQNAFRAEMSAFRAEMRSEFNSQRTLVQNEVLREIGPVRERLSLLEARHA